MNNVIPHSPILSINMQNPIQSNHQTEIRAMKQFKLIHLPNTGDLSHILTYGATQRANATNTLSANTIRIIKPTNKLKIKARSPLKFPKTNLRNRRINMFPDELQSKFEIWKQMCNDYEVFDSPQFDQYKDDIPKYKRKQKQATYEPDLQSAYNLEEVMSRNVTAHTNIINPNLFELHATPDNINDQFTDTLFTQYSKQPICNYTQLLADLPSFQPSKDANIQLVPLQQLKTATFVKPSHLRINHKVITNIQLPHLKTKISIPNSSTQVVSYILNDTGCSHSLTSKKWLNKYFPDAIITTLKLGLTTAGQVRKDSIIGYTDLTMTFTDLQGKECTYIDTFYILSDLETIDLILGQSILGDKSKMISQSTSQIIFRDPATNSRHPITFHRIDPKEQQTLQVNQLSLSPPLEFSKNYPITPLYAEIIPPQCTYTTVCHLPDIIPQDAPFMYGKLGFTHTDEISPIQQDLAITTIDTLTKLHINAFQQVTFVTKLQNKTNEPIYIQPTYIIGHLNVIENTEENSLDLEAYIKSLPHIQKYNTEELHQLSKVLDEYEQSVTTTQSDKPQRPTTDTQPPKPFRTHPNMDTSHSVTKDKFKNKTTTASDEPPHIHQTAYSMAAYLHCTSDKTVPDNISSNHSQMSQPLILTVDDNFQTRDPAFENKTHYTSTHGDSFTDNLGTTELRPDIVGTELHHPQTEKEFLSQFDLSHLPIETQNKFNKLFILLRQAFATDPTDIGHSTLVTMSIPTPQNAFAHQRQRYMDSQKLKFLRPVIQTYLRKGIIRLAEESRFASNLVLILKPRKSSPADVNMSKMESKQTLHNQYRLTQDMRNLNNLTDRFIFPLGNPEEIQTKCRGCLCTALDLQSAFTSMQLAPEDQHKTSFFADNQLYCWTRATQGLSNSPQQFSLLMSRVFSTEMSQEIHNILGEELWPKEWITQNWSDIVSYYVDDIVIHTAATDQAPKDSPQHHELHLQHVRRVITALHFAGLKISGSKSDFAIRKFKLLGVDIDTDKDQISMSERKAQAIIDLPKPSSLADIQIFIAILSYWSRFLVRFRQICIPLSRQLKTKQFVWGPVENRVYQHMKQLIIDRIILTIHDPHLKVHIFSDASFWASANILVQLGPVDKDFRIIGVHSKQFSPSELKTPTFNKECLAFITSLRQWSLTLYANETGLNIYCDASGIAWFYRSRQFSSRFTLAANFMSNFLNLPNFNICAIPGRHNCLADLFSRSFHAYSDQAKRKTFTLSRDRSKQLPPLQPYQTFDQNAIFHLLTESPLPEKTDIGTKIARDTKNPFTLTEEILIHQNKYPEEIYMEFDRFKQGFGQNSPSGQFVDNSTNPFNPTKTIDDDWKQITKQPSKKTISKPITPSCNVITTSIQHPLIPHEHIYGYLHLIQHLQQYTVNFVALINQNIKIPPAFISIAHQWTQTVVYLIQPSRATDFTQFLIKSIQYLNPQEFNACCNYSQLRTLKITDTTRSSEIVHTLQTTPGLFHQLQTIYMSIFFVFGNPKPFTNNEITPPGKPNYHIFNKNQNTKMPTDKDSILFRALSDIPPPLHFDHYNGNTNYTMTQNTTLFPKTYQIIPTSYQIIIPDHIIMIPTIAKNPQLIVHHRRHTFRPALSNDSDELILYNKSQTTIHIHPKCPLHIKFKYYTDTKVFQLERILPAQHLISTNTLNNPPRLTTKKLHMPNNLQQQILIYHELLQWDNAMDKYLAKQDFQPDNMSTQSTPSTIQPDDSPSSDQIYNTANTDIETVVPQLPDPMLTYEANNLSPFKLCWSQLNLPPLLEDQSETDEITATATPPPEIPAAEITATDTIPAATQTVVTKANQNSPSHSLFLGRLPVNPTKTATEKLQEQQQMNLPNQPTIDELNGNNQNKPPTPQSIVLPDETDLTAWSKHYLDNMKLPFDLNHKALPPLTQDQQTLIFHSSFYPDRSITRTTLITLQHLDSYCKKELTLLETNPEQQPANNRHRLVQQVLCVDNVDKDGHTITKIVIPISMASDLYRTLHAHYGHISNEKTLLIYNRFFYTQGIYQLSKQLHKSCLPCKVNKHLRPLPPPGDVRSLQHLINAPRQSLFMDIADTIKPSSRRQHKHILVMIDGFSQFVQLAAIRNKKAPTILAAYQQSWSNNFGHPFCISSDNANSFLMDFKQYLVRFGVATRSSYPYSQFQDYAEVGVKLLKQKLSALTADHEFLLHNRDWDLVLPDICQIINSQPLSPPFSHDRETLHFGNSLNHISPLAFYANNHSNTKTSQPPSLSDQGQFGPFTEYLTNQHNQTTQMRDDHLQIQHNKRRRLNAQTHIKQGSHHPNIFLPGMLIYMNVKPKNLQETAEPKRRLFRVLTSGARGITAIDTATFSTIRSNNFSSIEIPTHKDFAVLYPKEFFSEITSLSKDLYKRYQSAKTPLADKLTKAANDPFQDTEEATEESNLEKPQQPPHKQDHPLIDKATTSSTSQQELLLIDLHSKDGQTSKRLRPKPTIRYPT